MSDLADSITPPPAAASAVAPGTPDRKGHPFDPARHIPKMSKAGGTWIPKSPGRGGNKSKSAEPSSGSTSSRPVNTAPDAPAISSPSQADSPGVTMDELIPLADAPKPKAPEADAAKAQASAPEFPEVGPGEAPADSTKFTQTAGGTSAEQSPSSSAPRTDVKLGHQAAGELAARVTYALTGALIGDRKKARAVGEEHKEIRDAYAAFFQYRGVLFVGSAALGLILLAYCLGEARSDEIGAVVKGFFGKKKAPMPVIDVKATVVSETPPAAAPAPSAPATPRPFWENQ